MSWSRHIEHSQASDAKVVFTGKTSRRMGRVECSDLHQARELVKKPLHGRFVAVRSGGVTGRGTALIKDLEHFGVRLVACSNACVDRCAIWYVQNVVVYSTCLVPRADA